MDFISAKNLINQKYKINAIGNDFAEIPTGLFLKSAEGISLFLENVNGTAVISDGADVANGIGQNLCEIELETLANKYGYVLNDWHIEKNFESVKDIDSFVDLIIENFDNDDLVDLRRSFLNKKAD